MIDLKNLTIKKTLEHLSKKDFSAEELAKAYLDQIEKKNPEINAYLEVYDDVLEQAKNAKGELGGIPLAIKDNILIEGKTATSASKVLKGYKAPYNATAIAKLKAAGAVFIGRTNMDEFAMGGSTENSAFGVTKNPCDTTRVAGGSSGGSVAAVAADMALAALGSDTGGSVREPAAFCGVVGLKPTYGSVSRYGMMAMASSLNIMGPIGKTVSDTEILFNVIKGRDPLDSVTYAEDTYPKHTTKNVIGVPYHILENLDGELRKNFDASIEKLKKLGYKIVEITLPNISSALAVYYVIMPAEVSSDLARFDGVRFGLHVDGADLLDDYKKTRRQGFGPEVRRRILIGTYVLSAGYHDAYYNKALMLRQKISDEFKNAFKEVDAIVTPTAPGPAFKIGEKIGDPVAMYLEDIFTVPANIVGIPAISIPSGDINGLPLGLQIMAPHDSEDRIFNIGKKFLNEI